MDSVDTDFGELGKLMKRMKDVVEENRRLQSFKERNKELLIKLQAVRGLCEDMELLINPVLKITVRKKGITPGRNAEIMDELYEKMKSGTQVTTDLIRLAYPDMEGFRGSWIFLKLQKLVGVRKRTDGKKAYLYMEV